MEIDKKIIGKQTGLEIPLFKLNLGQGEEKISIISGLHGDETSGLLVLNHLINSLKKEKLNKQINIFPSVNILGMILRQRENPINNQDLNRNFPGKKWGNFSERITDFLMKEIRNSSLVIDLHTFETNCPITAILMSNGTKKVKQKSIQAIRNFNPDIVWELNLSDAQEIKLSGSLGPILHRQDIPNFAIEMPPNNLIVQKEIKQISSGIKRIILDKKKNSDNRIPIIKRQKIFSNKSGVLKANKKKLDKVHKNDIIGEIYELPRFEHHLIKTPFSGFILTLRNNCLVNTGSQIGVIAKPTDEL